MRREGYSTWSVSKMGSNLLCQGEKGGKKRGKEGRGQRSKLGGKFKCHEKRKGRKAMDEQELSLSSFFEIGSCFGDAWRLTAKATS